MSKIQVYLRDKIMKRKAKRIKDTNFSLISSNCTGAMLLHELGFRFNSPFVNLWLYPKDYLTYLENMEEYNNKKLVFIKKEGISYPVAKLGDIEIYFQHYKTEEEARKKWIERSSRMNFERIYIFMTDRDGCTYEDLKRFDNLKYKNKVCFTHKEYKELNSTMYIKEFKDNEEVGMMFEFKGKHSLKKYYDVLDCVKWFNS